MDLDPAIERVLVRAGLSKDDLKNRDVTEAVDLIFARSGGVKAVEQELRKAGMGFEVRCWFVCLKL